MKATITLNGAQYIYPEGPVMPDYFVEKGAVGTITFHLGLIWPANVARHLGPHHVKIENDSGAVIFEAEIPAHYWNSEWRLHAETPLTIKRTPAALVAANLIFPFGNTGGKIQPVASYQYQGPMSSAGITIYMPTTGERPDIGWVTDPAGLFMLGGPPGPMLAWAQANASCPLHFRDEKTGKPIDLTKYPRANAYDEPDKQGAPWLDKGPPSPQSSGYHVYGGGWEPQQAHFCDMAYVACIAAQDSGLLREVQYDANFCVLSNAYQSNIFGVAIVTGERRGIAWGLGMLFKAHAATKDFESRNALPADCMPSSYFKTLLDNSLKYYTALMNGPIQSAFHICPPEGRYAPWMQDYLVTSLSLGVLTGHSDWVDFYLFNLRNVIDRTSGTTGFPPGYGTGYWQNLCPGGDGANPPYTYQQMFDALVGDPDIRMTQAQHDALLADPMNGGKAFTGGEYNMTTRACLVMASYLDKKGLAPVRTRYPDFDQALANSERMFRANGSVNARISVVD